MTKSEIIQKTNSVEQADFLIDIVLKRLQKPFIVTAVESELKEVRLMLDQLQEAGLVYKVNDSYKVNWGAEYKVYGTDPGAYWHATEEQHMEADAVRADLNRADNLIYRMHRIESLLEHL